MIDDRGKYIYINDVEMEAIYKTVMSKGVLTKSELINECSRLIRLEPTEEDKLKIKEEENKILQDLNKDFQGEIEAQG